MSYLFVVHPFLHWFLEDFCSLSCIFDVVWLEMRSGRSLCDPYADRPTYLASSWTRYMDTYEMSSPPL